MTNLLKDVHGIALTTKVVISQKLFKVLKSTQQNGRGVHRNMSAIEFVSLPFTHSRSHSRHHRFLRTNIYDVRWRSCVFINIHML